MCRAISGLAVGILAGLATTAAAQPPAAPPCNIFGWYGLQCHGSVFTGAALEQITQIGTVSISTDGLVEGWATVSSSGGSVPTYVAGVMESVPTTCERHRLTYTTNRILLPGGGHIDLPPFSVEAAPADGGREILGVGIAPPGLAGDLVPRMTCRLMRLQDVDLALTLRMATTGGAALTGAFQITEPPVGAAAAPVTLNLQSSQRFSLTAPHKVGACTFVSFVNPATGTFSLSRTLSGNDVRSQTWVARYQCPA